MNKTKRNQLKIIRQYADAVRELHMAPKLPEQIPQEVWVEANTALASEGIRLLWAYDMTPEEEQDSIDFCICFEDTFYSGNRWQE